MEISLIGRRYKVKDASYSKDLSGNCQFPLLGGQEGIIIHQPYTECHKGRVHLFVDIVIPNNPFYKYHYRVLFYEWGLLDKSKREQINTPISGIYGIIYRPTYNTDNCRMVDNKNVLGYLMGTDCEIISDPMVIDIVDRTTNKCSYITAIIVRSFETGIEYYIPYEKEWVVKPSPTNEDNKWSFCPHCGKMLK